MNDESEFEKLLKESLADTDNILKEKSGNMTEDKDLKKYNKVFVSHDDLYDDIQDIDFNHKKNGIGNKILDNLKSKVFKFKDEEILDLHGLNTYDAEEAINIFFEYHNSIRSKYLLIIHGKGTKNQNKTAPLKRLVEKIVISSPHILAANSANKSNGGRGATVLLMKS